MNQAAQIELLQQQVAALEERIQALERLELEGIIGAFEAVAKRFHHLQAEVVPLLSELAGRKARDAWDDERKLQ